jgi:cation:H+ antiporter
MKIIDILLSPSLLWLVFLVLATIVSYLAIMLSKCVAALGEKTRLGGAFLGGFVLSLITSLPELITSLTSSVINNPTLAYTNIFGANALTAAFVGVLDIIFIKKMIFRKVSAQNMQIITIMVIINALTLFSLLVGSGLEIVIGPVKISGLFFAVFVFYIYFIYTMYNNTEKDKDVDPSGLSHLSLKQVILMLVGVTVALVIFTSLLTSVTNVMAGSKGYNIGNGLAGALLLAICTSLPELVSSFTLARMGQGNMAIAGIIGSHLFNMTILFYGDIAYYQEGTLDFVIHSGSYLSFMGLVIINLIISLLLFVSLFKQKITNKLIYVLPSILIVVSYLVGWFSGLLS